ncbi:hypothetical protein OG723_44450 (plasmid) [Streptomyces sp. NBC_01278]|uniref:hypothetical protein n=1 Tax=Streptomyces sp. NBC_01278 TaxID=2903809 RepID=UPI002E37C259|nr:hypothetical protein [Streptomyces sp. NBC_01278]
MTAIMRAALRLAQSRLPTADTGPQYLTRADMLRPLSDHILCELRDDIDRELHGRAYVALTDAIRYHLRQRGLQDHHGSPPVAATFTVTNTHPDGPCWDVTTATVRYADATARTVDFMGTSVEDELMELVNAAAEYPEGDDVLTVPLLTL